MQASHPRAGENHTGSIFPSKALCVFFDAADLVVPSICESSASVAGANIRFSSYLREWSLSNRAGVVLARPSSRTAGHSIRIDDALHGAISSSDQKEGSADQDENVDENQEHPLRVADLAVPVVVQPHACHGVEAHQSSEKGANKGHELAEDRDAAGDAVGDNGDAKGA